jgi:ribosomal protein L29
MKLTKDELTESLDSRLKEQLNLMYQDQKESILESKSDQELNNED